MNRRRAEQKIPLKAQLIRFLTWTALGALVGLGADAVMGDVVVWTSVGTVLGAGLGSIRTVTPSSRDQATEARR